VQRLSRLDAVIVQSRRVAEIYTDLGVDASRVRVMQFSLRHLERIAPREIGPPSGPVRFATLNGGASVQKGAEVVLGALEQLTNAGLADRFELTVLGWAPEETVRRLERFPSARYGGWYDPERLDVILEGFDVGIVPSVWEEAYGYVGVEFLAKGVPVIGNARGGIVEYTRDGETGWLNQDASAAGLASIMADIVERPAQVSELNARIRRDRARILKPFAEHAREMEAVYQEVLTGRGGSRC
jgi:glycosyltransferase involved in cell wall biosynthesis